jgi:hypothetical protein
LDRSVKPAAAPYGDTASIARKLHIVNRIPALPRNYGQPAKTTVVSLWLYRFRRDLQCPGELNLLRER